ncbi:MAG: helix-turn-helix domain-containing protein [Oscillospiraceae bacterium]|nr:helix-turn-helix domain-containing protein [Oscillospiraceae bacterium]
MAARLTDKQKKKIIADYIQFGSYTAVAKLNGVSKDTVKRIVQNCADFAQKAQQKKEENTADVLKYMEHQRDNVCELLDIYLEELKSPEKIEAAGLREIATTMAILIDKYIADKKDNKVSEEVRIIDDI